MIRTPGLALLNVLKLCTWLDKVLLRPNILFSWQSSTRYLCRDNRAVRPSVRDMAAPVICNCALESHKVTHRACMTPRMLHQHKGLGTARYLVL